MINQPEQQRLGAGDNHHENKQQHIEKCRAGAQPEPRARHRNEIRRRSGGLHERRIRTRRGWSGCRASRRRCRSQLAGILVPPVFRASCRARARSRNRRRGGNRDGAPSIPLAAQAAKRRQHRRAHSEWDNGAPNHETQNRDGVERTEDQGANQERDQRQLQRGEVELLAQLRSGKSVHRHLAKQKRDDQGEH